MKTKMEKMYQRLPGVSTCGLLDTLDFSRMTSGAMNDNEIDRFVQHCEECDECSQALWSYQKDLITDQEEKVSDVVSPEDQLESSSVRFLEQNATLINRSINFLDKLRND